MSFLRRRHVSRCESRYIGEYLQFGRGRESLRKSEIIRCELKEGHAGKHAGSIGSDNIAYSWLPSESLEGEETDMAQG